MDFRVTNIHDAESWFEVLPTTKQSQTAVMTLQSHGESSEEMKTHQRSDQVVLILKGEVDAEIGAAHRVLKQGDTCIIPAGTPHRLTNPGTHPAMTFNVYTPPEYAPREKG